MVQGLLASNFYYARHIRFLKKNIKSSFRTVFAVAGTVNQASIHVIYGYEKRDITKELLTTGAAVINPMDLGV